MWIKGEPKKKKRPPVTFKCSKSKTIMHGKMKSSHHIDLKRSTWCKLFSFLGIIALDLDHFKVLGIFFVLFTHYISICCKNLFTHFIVAIFVCFLIYWQSKLTLSSLFCQILAVFLCHCFDPNLPKKLQNSLMWILLFFEKVDKPEGGGVGQSG